MVNIFLVGGFAFWSRRLTPEKLGVGGYIALVCILVFAIIWSFAVYWLFRYFEMNSNLEKALRSSALDAMNERELRMEIAESKNMAEENARLEERERISRDIHNAVGHTLSAATVTLDAAQMLIDTDATKANQKIDQANERIHEAIGINAAETESFLAESLEGLVRISLGIEHFLVALALLQPNQVRTDDVILCCGGFSIPLDLLLRIANCFHHFGRFFVVHCFFLPALGLF